MKRFNFWGAIASIAPIIPYLLLGGVILFFLDKFNSLSFFKKRDISSLVSDNISEIITVKALDSKKFDPDSVASLVRSSIKGAFNFNVPNLIKVFDGISIDDFESLHSSYFSLFGDQMNEDLKSDFFIYANPSLYYMITDLYERSRLVF